MELPRAAKASRGFVFLGPWGQVMQGIFRTSGRTEESGGAEPKPGSDFVCPIGGLNASYSGFEARRR